jgi:hypothetical protein
MSIKLDMIWKLDIQGRGATLTCNSNLHGFVIQILLFPRVVENEI